MEYSALVELEWNPIAAITISYQQLIEHKLCCSVPYYSTAVTVLLGDSYCLLQQYKIKQDSYP